MRRITVDAYEVALVLKRGKVLDVLRDGKYWIGMGRTVHYFDCTKPMSEIIEFSILKENSELCHLLNFVSIRDNEIGIEMKDGLFKRVLTSGNYAYWKSPVNYEVIKVNLNDPMVESSIPKNVLRRTGLLPFLCVHVVESYQKGILFIDAEYQEILEPGIYSYWKSNKTPTVQTIDMRVLPLEISGQEILTKDKAGIRINFEAQYQVIDIQKAVLSTKDFTKQLYVSVQLALRQYMSSKTLDQLLANKELIGPYVMGKTQSAAELLGIEIISGGIKDIILPGDVKEIMNQVLVAQKRAQANTIMRQEETASTRSLLNTAKLMETNAMLMKLKEMEYMEKIAEKVGEITLNGGSRVMDQLQELLVSGKP